MVARGEKRKVLLTAQYSVIEPLFAIHLLGTIRDHGHEGMFMPVHKVDGVPDWDPVYRRAEEWGATDVGFNVYDGWHLESYAASAELQRRGFTTLLGGPHATHQSERAAGHFNLVFKGQSYDSFGAYLDGDLDGFAVRTTKEDWAKARLDTKVAAFRSANRDRSPSRKQREAMLREADAEVSELVDSPAFASAVEEKLASRILFSRFLSPTFPMGDRATLYRDNPDLRSNPIKNSITGEGCPFACTYCYNVAWNSEDMYGRFQRRILRPIDDVITELRGLGEYDTKLIYFQDDVFGFEMDWLEEFMARYKDEVGIPFHAQLRLELVNDEKGEKRLDLMKSGGCTGATVAIESGDYLVRRDTLDRAMKDKHVFIGCRNMREAGFSFRTEQMLGMFGPETRAGGSVLSYDLKTLRVNCLTHPDISWTSIYQPYSGTVAGDKTVEQSLMSLEAILNNDGIKDSFFDESALDYDPVYLDQVRILQRLFSTFAHIDRGHEIAEKFLTERVTAHSHRDLEDFLVVATDLAKMTKVTLYDNELYHTRDETLTSPDSLDGALGRQTKGFRKAIAPSSSSGMFRGVRDVLGRVARGIGRMFGSTDLRVTSLEEIASRDLSTEQRAVLDNMTPLWEYVPRGDVIAEKLLDRLEGYSAEQREAFIGLTSELNEVTTEILALGPLDREAEIARLIEEEEKMFADEKTAAQRCRTETKEPSAGIVPLTVSTSKSRAS